jgi:hypothetical protein
MFIVTFHCHLWVMIILIQTTTFYL